MVCPFAGLEEPVAWEGTPAPERDAPALLARPPVVLTDLTLPPFDRAGLTRIVRELAGSCDGLLVGEHQARPDFPPTQMTGLVRDAGGAPVITLTCRDRNRVVLDQELCGLVEAGAEAVFCATGDARAVGVRPEVTQVFDLDGTELAAHAAAAGLTVGVPESPETPPLRIRPGRLAEKQRAGAQFAILNHVGSPARLAEFSARARQAGCTVPLIAGVAVYTDERSAAVLSAFPGLHLEPERVAAVVGAADPVAAGIAEAVAEARALLAVEGVVGVNLSGLATGRGPVEGAAIKAAIGRELQEA
ncbi:methylenetetrahydrofolate reductase [Pseudonocardia lutea]|uniref:Methylenetetrahydrofolate reductase n=1 Tax=Pseudonocardia lutea TaxID=2172015 RepID=A0ABW1I2E1_9PSEU